MSKDLGLTVINVGAEHRACISEMRLTENTATRKTVLSVSHLSLLYPKAHIEAPVRLTGPLPGPTGRPPISWVGS